MVMVHKLTVDTDVDGLAQKALSCFFFVVFSVLA